MEGQTLLEQHHARKAVVEIPEVHTTDTPLVVSAIDDLACEPSGQSSQLWMSGQVSFSHCFD